MPGVTALRKVQLGKESTPGTAVAATALLRLNGLWEDLQETKFSEVHEGYLSGRRAPHVPLVLAKIAVEGEATFEQLPYILEMAVKSTSPTTDTGSGYIYTYPFATTSQLTARTYTIEAGDDQAMEESAYCYCQDFELSGAAGEAWQVSANIFGRQIVDTDTFTPSTDITVTAVEEMLFQKTKLYIDADTDAIGTTQKSSTLLAANLKVKGGQMHQHTGDGNLYFSFLKNIGPEVILEITFEHDATATTAKTNWRAKTPRLIRLLIQGSSLTSSGAYAVKTCIIDLAGYWEKIDKIDEIDGNDVIKGTFRAQYNETAGLFAQILVVNELSALP